MCLVIMVDYTDGISLSLVVEAELNVCCANICAENLGRCTATNAKPIGLALGG